MRESIIALASRPVMLLCFIVATMWGGAKHINTITYPRTDPDVAYLTDSGSWVSNDVVHVDFIRVPIVPVSANLYIDRRGILNTNDTDWVTIFASTFDQITLPLELTIPNATNYNYAVYTDWTPGPSVVTNGVWHAFWGLDRREGVHLIPVRTAVLIDGQVIATPKSKADNEAERNAYE